MKYILATRLAGPDDKDSMHIEPPDSDASNLYLSSLAEDIQKLSCVKSVARNRAEFVIEVVEETTKKGLQNAMKPYFAGRRFGIIRFVSLRPVQ